MSIYHLSIVTTNGQIFDDQIESLSATGISGSFGVLGKHAPMVVALKSGPLTIKKNGKEIYHAVSSGVLEINDQSDCLLLADYAVKTDSYEQAKNHVSNTIPE